MYVYTCVVSGFTSMEHRGHSIPKVIVKTESAPPTHLHTYPVHKLLRKRSISLLLLRYEYLNTDDNQWDLLLTRYSHTQDGSENRTAGINEQRQYSNLLDHSKHHSISCIEDFIFRIVITFVYKQSRITHSYEACGEERTAFAG